MGASSKTERIGLGVKASGALLLIFFTIPAYLLLAPNITSTRMPMATSSCIDAGIIQV